MIHTRVIEHNWALEEIHIWLHERRQAGIVTRAARNAEAQLDRDSPAKRPAAPRAVRR